MKSQCRDFESSSLSDDTETETRNIGLKVETETETECKEFVKIHGTDIPYNILTVNLRDSKNKRW